jgi:hypothetical protein
MKKIVVLLGIVAIFTTAQGQYVTDALRYAETFPTITARSMSMGGAFTSLGGDFSSTLNNPAGLGLYRKSEFEFSPALNYTTTSADYLGKKNDDFATKFNIGSLGYVGTYNSNKDKGLVSASFGLGYLRQNNFGSNVYIRGTNAHSSLADYFMNNAETKNPNNLDAFYERLAFDGYIIDTVPGSPTSYQTPVLLPTDQRKTIETHGGVGQWSFATGLNFSNIVYVGLGLGIHQLQFDQYTVHSEFDTDPAHDFSQFSFNEDLKVNGTGFNMNMGMIVRLFKIMRVGASLQLPTYYKIRENYYNTLVSSFKNGDRYSVVPTDVNGDQIPEGTFGYKLYTPMKAQGGLSVQIGSIGIVTADLEYVDYAHLKLTENDHTTDFSGTNSDIKAVYKSVVNLKIGGEVRFNNFSVRLGGGYYPSPLNSSVQTPDIYSFVGNVPDAYTEFTTGIGYRNNNFFFDLGFSRLGHSEKYNLYSANVAGTDYVNVANLSQVQYRFVATLGFRF